MFQLRELEDLTTVQVDELKASYIKKREKESKGGLVNWESMLCSELTSQLRLHLLIEETRRLEESDGPTYEKNLIMKVIEGVVARHQYEALRYLEH